MNKVSAFAQRTRDISNVVDMINDIADKTNLAPNAAIEAARAEHMDRVLLPLPMKYEN